MRGTLISRLAIYSLLILLGIELLAHYDSPDRQAALAVTNLIAVGAMLVFERVFQRRAEHFPSVASLALALGVWFDAAGNFLHFYARLWWWDKLAHGVGSGAVAIAIWSLLSLFRRQALSRRWRGLISLTAATTLACFYEVSEYLGDLWFHTHRVTDLYDTPDDIMWNTIAVLFVVLLVMWREKYVDALVKNQ